MDAPVPISEMESFDVTTTLGGTVLFVPEVLGNAVVLPVVLIVIVAFVRDASAPPVKLFLLANLPVVLLYFMTAFDNAIYELIST
eukprot:scaffold47365_cov68-Attheya_sp.AAC.1